MSRRVAFLLALLLCASLFAGCGSKTPANGTAIPGSTAGPEASASAAPESAAGERVLVVYFGAGESGAGAARCAALAADLLGADLYELNVYDSRYDLPEADLRDLILTEKEDKARPAIQGSIPSPDNYDTFILCAPEWKEDWPMVFYTFLEGVNMSGKKLSPLIVYEEDGSGQKPISQLALICPYSEVTEGLRLPLEHVSDREQTVEVRLRSWLRRLGYEID